MTKKPQKRDNEYYLERLRVDHPAIYADYRAKKFKNAAEAFVAAGLRKERSALDLLRTAWSRASAAEQDAFKALIGCVSPISTSATAITPSRSGVVINGMRQLPPALASDVRSIIARREMKVGDVMRELGLNRLNASLGMALGRGTQVQDSLITALTDWVDRNRTT